MLIVNNGSGLVTIDPNGSETINGVATVTLRPSESALISCNGSKWVGLITIDRSISVTKTVDTQRASQVTPTLDPELRLTFAVDDDQAIEANTDYAFDAFIIAHSAIVAPDLKWSWLTGSGTLAGDFIALNVTRKGIGYNAIQGRADSVTATVVLGLEAGEDTILRFNGHYRLNAAGPFSFLWSQNTSSVTPTTIRAGSWIRMTKL